MGQGASQTFFSGQQGLRALHVWENSPAAKAGIIPFIDFIIGVQDIERKEPQIQSLQDFINLLKENENKDFQFIIFNILTQQQRTLQINLNKAWPKANNVLGILFRHESYINACNNIMKITNIENNSPAYHAGLKNNEDFILGFQIRKVESQMEFASIVKNYAQKKESFSLCVYNQVENSVRYLKVEPNEQWGGNGCLGCELGFGLLNKVNIQDNADDKNFDQQIINSTVNEVHNQNGDRTKNQIVNEIDNKKNEKIKEDQQLLEKVEKEPELLPKEINFKKQFYSEKVQVEHEITGEQLLDIQIDLSQYIES